MAYKGPSANYGLTNDPMVGSKIGGINVFGGGLGLYTTGGRLLGGLGLSGDTSCADHRIAWRVRHKLNLDRLAGVEVYRSADGVNWQRHQANPVFKSDPARDWVHCDIMDFRFVPNLTIGPLVVKALRKVTKATLDVHLMIVEPEHYIDRFSDAGADIISVHVEASPHLHRTLSHIRSLGKRAGVVLNPSTSEETVKYVLDQCDLILVMSVNPGFGGQSFIQRSAEKVAEISWMCEQLGATPLIQVDGGINPDNAGRVIAAGAKALVAGNAVFKGGNYKANIAAIRNAAALARGEAA